MHCHPGLSAIYLRRDLSREHRPPTFWNPFRQQLDLPRAHRHGLRVMTATVYATPALPGPRPRAMALNMIDAIDAAVARTENSVVARERGSVAPIFAAGKLAVLHAVEGGHHLGGSLEAIDELAARGVRYLTLTHFVHNGLAQPARLGLYALLRGQPGLTAFGREVVKRCEAHGVLIDLTHCSDRSFADVATVATKPLLATHVGCRRFFATERNLSDEQLRLIAQSGGVVGIISWSWLLKRRGLRATREDFLDTLVHAASVAGTNHVGIGTDFDGMVWSAAGVRDASCYPSLTTGLRARGFTDNEVRAIMGGNYLRVLREAV